MTTQKIVILGDGRVGKTSILMRYFNNKFDQQEQSTINPSNYEKIVEAGEKTYKFSFWDTAGQEKFNALNSIYYNGASGAILVYDSAGFDTFSRVENWVKQLQEIVSKDIPFVIVGNKVDLIGKDEMDKCGPTVDAYCRKENCTHFYCSAKTGYQVNVVFEKIIQIVLSKEKQGSAKKQNRGRQLKFEDESSAPKKKGGCC